MPEGASPDDWLAAGPWCFAGQEARFPGWEREFLFAPEPLADGSRLPKAARGAQTLALLAIPKIAAKLSAHAEDHAPIYWQALLLPWTLNVAKQLIERGMRLEALIAAFGDAPLKLPAPPVSSFSFQDEASFMLLGCMNPDWNHWLFGQLLAGAMPKSWQWLPREGGPMPRARATAPTRRFSPREAMRNIARKFLFKLPFPPLKGMTLRQSLLFSWATLKNAGKKSENINLEAEYCQPGILGHFYLPENWLDIMLACLPESLKRLDHGRKPIKRRKAALKIASVRAFEDAAYRRELALWLEGGNRLAYVQHGCNYGQVRVACDAPLLEYSHDVFFTWGWSEYSAARGNFQPMPYPQLAKIANAWHGQDADKLILVGSEMAATACRLDSRPTPLQNLEYRASKAAFFGALPGWLLAKSLYRPYFTLPGCLEDAEWLLPKFPGLGRCVGPLAPQMLSCRLLVLDNPGTTLLEAFAAGIPVLAYWDRRYWPLGKECDRLLDSLEECGIWQPTPEKAAEKAVEVWENPRAWLESAPVASAYALWRKWQARLPSGMLEKIWMEKLENI